jgi:hypothetical protein
LREAAERLQFAQWQQRHTIVTVLQADFAQTGDSAQ